MITVGLIGGIACGKTTIASKLRNLGAAVISADPIVHDVLEIPEIKDQMRIRWHKYEYHPDWPRRRIAELVFRNPQELKFLEEITTAPVLAEISRRVALYHPNSPLRVWKDVYESKTPLLKKE